MTIITPTTQNVVYSAITQKTALSGANNTVPMVGDGVTNTPDVALTSSVSNQIIGTSGLYNASLDLAGLSSKLQVAQAGTGQIANILQNLQNIAQQLAQGSGNTNSLEAEFQSLYSQINQIVAETSFSGSSLLDGSFSLTNSTPGFTQGTEQNASPPIVPNLTTQGLFGSNTPSVATPQDAANAVAGITNAENTVNTANSNVEEINNQVNFVIASIETAQANSFASASTLTESELGNSGFTGFAAKLQEEPASSANTQTGKLSAGTLTLLSQS